MTASEKLRFMLARTSCIPTMTRSFKAFWSPNVFTLESPVLVLRDLYKLRMRERFVEQLTGGLKSGHLREVHEIEEHYWKPYNP